ncbi:MAG: hypothetical protein Q7K43_02660, partial [Candidatus Woesearchaeota archaeon]|nr:hypothetical protein [Candidatus Woesearchaeota archaeon]
MPKTLTLSSKQKSPDIIVSPAGKIPGQYLINTQIVSQSNKVKQKVKNIVARVYPLQTDCLHLNRYEFDIYDDPNTQFDGFDTGELLNNCVDKPVKTKIDVKSWNNAMKSALPWAIAAFAVSAVTNPKGIVSPFGIGGSNSKTAAKPAATTAKTGTTSEVDSKTLKDLQDSVDRIKELEKQAAVANKTAAEQAEIQKELQEERDALQEKVNKAEEASKKITEQQVRPGSLEAGATCNEDKECRSYNCDKGFLGLGKGTCESGDLYYLEDGARCKNDELCKSGNCDKFLGLFGGTCKPEESTNTSTGAVVLSNTNIENKNSGDYPENGIVSATGFANLSGIAFNNNDTRATGLAAFNLSGSSLLSLIPNVLGAIIGVTNPWLAGIGTFVIGTVINYFNQDDIDLTVIQPDVITKNFNILMVLEQEPFKFIKDPRIDVSAKEPIEEVVQAKKIERVPLVFKNV